MIFFSIPFLVSQLFDKPNVTHAKSMYEQKGKRIKKKETAVISYFK